MTYKELVAEVSRLSLEEQQALLQELSHIIGAAKASRERGAAPAEAVRGMLKREGPAPTDEELKEEYTQYLIEKYS
jgi:predicted nuclease of restriction endonuclease-like RecB superfamily